MSDRLKRFLRIAEVEAITGLPHSTLYQAMAEGSFPKNFRIGARAVAWREEDVARWQAERLAEAGADPQAMEVA